MAVPLLGLHRKSQTSKFPFPMERAVNLDRNGNDYVIDITSSSEASPSSPSQDRASSGQQQIDNQPSTSTRIPVYQPAFSASGGGSNTWNSSLNRRERENGRARNRSPLNSGLWISVELVLTLSQIIAAIVVLAISRHEHPRTPLGVWVVGYAFGCAAILPLLYWRYHHRNQGSERESTQSYPTSSQNDLSTAPSSGTLDRDSRRPSGSDSQGAHHVGAMSSRYRRICFCEN